MFVTHAYKKVAALQQQLTKLQLLHQAIDQQQLSEQELRKQVMTEEVVQEELEAQKRNLDVEHQQRVAAIREEMESEMRSGMVTSRKAGSIFGTTKEVHFYQTHNLGFASAVLGCVQGPLTVSLYCLCGSRKQHPRRV